MLHLANAYTSFKTHTGMTSLRKPALTLLGYVTCHHLIHLIPELCQTKILLHFLDFLDILDSEILAGRSCLIHLPKAPGATTDTGTL